MLTERGVTRYVGSTDTRNRPMLKVFEANGCSILLLTAGKLSL